MNPGQFRLLLAGPKVSRLLPFVTARGYIADGCVTGAEALDHMRRAARHVLLIELDLEDILLADLLDVVRRENLAGAVILLEDPAKSGLIVSTLLRGVDAYVATPPDELYLFRIIDRQLLAQWALAQSSKDAEEQEAKQRADKNLQMERAKVTELVKEIGSLRGQLQDLRALAKESAKDTYVDDSTKQMPMTRPAGSAGGNPKPPRNIDFEDVSAETAPHRQPAPAHLADDETSPRGWPSLKSAARDDVGFDDAPKTRPANTEEVERPATALDATVPRRPAAEHADDEIVEVEDDADLFLDIEDERTSEFDVTPAQKRPG